MANINDIKSVISIIEVCTQRGAFKSEELEHIGILYNKLNLFVKESLEVLEKQTDNNKSKHAEPDKENTSSDENGGHSMEFSDVKTI